MRMAVAALMLNALKCVLRAVGLVFCLAFLLASFAVVAAVSFGAGWCFAEHGRARALLESTRADLAARGEPLAWSAPPAVGRGASGKKLLEACAELGRLAETSPIGSAWPRCREPLGGGVARVAWRGESAPVRSGTLSWEAAAAALEKARPALARLEGALGAVGAPRDTVVFPEASSRTAAAWLAWAAIERLHALDNPGALRHITSLIALAEVHREEPRIESVLWRCTILKGALRLSWEFLQAPAIDGASIEQLAAAWAPCRPLGALVPALRRERARGLDVVEVLVRSTEAHLAWGDHLSAIKDVLAGRGTDIDWKAEALTWLRYAAWRLMWADEEIARFLESFQIVIGHLERAAGRLCWLDLRDAWAAAEQGLRGRESLAGWDRMLLDANVLNGGRAACQVVVEFEAERRMLRAAAALLRYQLDRGAPPPRLEALVPDYLPEVPEDPMDLRLLRYRLDPFGEAVIYSIGTRGGDNQGDPNRPDARPAAAVSHGADMVWPLADFPRTMD